MKKRGIQKDGKIVTGGAQLFNVPWNEEGRLFQKLCRKFRNPACKLGLRFRGRGHRANKSEEQSISLKKAQWAAGYIHPNPGGLLRALDYKENLLHSCRHDRDYYKIELRKVQELLKEARAAILTVARDEKEARAREVEDLKKALNEAQSANAQLGEELARIKVGAATECEALKRKLETARMGQAAINKERTQSGTVLKAEPGAEVTITIKVK